MVTESVNRSAIPVETSPGLPDLSALGAAQAQKLISLMLNIVSTEAVIPVAHIIVECVASLFGASAVRLVTSTSDGQRPAVLAVHGAPEHLADVIDDFAYARWRGRSRCRCFW